MDDMIGAGDENDPEYNKAREALQKEFNFQYWITEQGEFEFCGNKLTQLSDGAWKIQEDQAHVDHL